MHTDADRERLALELQKRVTALTVALSNLVDTALCVNDGEWAACIDRAGTDRPIDHAVEALALWNGRSFDEEVIASQERRRYQRPAQGREPTMSTPVCTCVAPTDEEPAIDPRWECAVHAGIYLAADAAATLLCEWEDRLKRQGSPGKVAEVRAAMEALRNELPEYHGT